MKKPAPCTERSVVVLVCCTWPCRALSATVEEVTPANCDWKFCEESTSAENSVSTFL